MLAWSESRSVEVLEADARTKQDPSNLTELVYELLDAHADTIVLAGGTPATAGLRPAAGLPPADRTPAWAAHLDYLRDLQRVGRECLARLS
jgi:hypothetical protein